MKTAPLKDIKFELKEMSKEDLSSLCLLMAKFKKENKELLTYLLYDRENEAGYVQDIKNHIDDQFDAMNKENYYLVNKGVRKLLRSCKKYIRYSKKKETEAEVLIYFCSKVLEVSEYHDYNAALLSIYDKQLSIVRKKIAGLHEDLQYDYQLMIDDLLGE
jgi:hypothetical protein